jgi:hypothetical protein
MRDYKLIIPSDCVATVEKKENMHALKYLNKVLKADTSTSDNIDFKRLKSASRKTAK